MPQIVLRIPRLQPSATRRPSSARAACPRFTGCAGPGHSVPLAWRGTVEGMNTKQRHQAPHTTNRRQSARPISQEEVRFHFVATRQPADPAQIPWLDEISGSHDVNEASSGII